METTSSKIIAFEVPSPSLSNSSLSHPPGFSPVGHESKLDKVYENGEVNEGSGVDSLAQNDVESVKSPQLVRMEGSSGSVGQRVESKGGSILGVLEEVIRVGQAMGFSMEGCEKDIQNIIGKQGDDLETKMDAMSHMDVKFMWGNSNYDFVCSDSLGSSGGILCIWEPSIFKKDNVTISDNFVAIYGTWLTNNVKVLLISVYAPQQPAYKRVLWEYLSTLLGRWNGDVIIMGDFNEVRPLCLDRHLSDHRPILLREILLDFGPTPFRFYHSWFSYDGFDEMVEKTWRSFSYSDTNGMIRFKKKLQDLKSSIRLWVKDKRASLSSLKHDIVSELREIDKELDSGLVSDEQLARRLDLKGQLHDINDKEASDRFQKSKVRWAIEGDENSSFFHGIINKKRSQLAIRGILVDGSWQSDPQVVKEIVTRACVRFGKGGLNVVVNLRGIRLNSSLSLSHLFYADDALIIGEWSSDNLRGIINVLKCFFLASGLQINIHKSQLLGVGVARPEIEAAASSIGCSIMENQFRYLGVTVGGNMSRCKAWSDIVSKLRSRLSKWKTKTLSIGGRLTLLKSVLGASPLYCMSIFKAPKGVLKEMESIRNKFFIGADNWDKKITWVAWDKVLASKKNGGLGVSSYFALNRALLFKWIWRFVSQDDSLWFHVMQALYGPNIDSHSIHYSSNWCSILKEMQMLKAKALCDSFPRMFALEMEKNCMVATKMVAPVDASFRRSVRGGIELVQFNELRAILESVSLSHSLDRWICNASSDGSFRVKDIRNLIDDLILPSGSGPTKWMKNKMLIHIRLQCGSASSSVLLRNFVEGGILIWQSWSSFHTWTVGFSSIQIAPKQQADLVRFLYCGHRCP
ncbi:RNA-directed DNA polymerase, eukaryota [Tanacetum coccineum]